MLVNRKKQCRCISVRATDWTDGRILVNTGTKRCADVICAVK